MQYIQYLHLLCHREEQSLVRGEAVIFFLKNEINFLASVKRPTSHVLLYSGQWYSAYRYATHAQQAHKISTAVYWTKCISSDLRSFHLLAELDCIST